ncbi:DUF2064 domain-containing protein [Panacibacter sp. DH6]|uniref:DUF2064 domain-containing protein n=1 Tax=Panacibacter microcysteis TaxID=2793269 RepID=A0A931E598_9BACT|nr:DUF2064 domain-containing protein [Panacibacter microcysteis]MBG9375530.1 DUF2064 domain-containing protein [Panacibacter microcysteis]
MKAALIILVHDPIICRVKTGSIDMITNQENSLIRRQLLQHTRRITSELNADKFLFLKANADNDDVWLKGNYIKRLQRGRGRGEIITNAFETVFSMGYTRVVMIGSDSIESETIHIIQAFNNLNTYDVVVSPVEDKAYYLLGLKKFQPQLFKNKMWNTSLLLQQTLHTIDELKLTYHLQQVINDVEEEKEQYLLQHRQ